MDKTIEVVADAASKSLITPKRLLVVGAAVAVVAGTVLIAKVRANKKAEEAEETE